MYPVKELYNSHCHRCLHQNSPPKVNCMKSPMYSLQSTRSTSAHLTLISCSKFLLTPKRSSYPKTSPLLFLWRYSSSPSPYPVGILRPQEEHGLSVVFPQFPKEYLESAGLWGLVESEGNVRWKLDEVVKISSQYSYVKVNINIKYTFIHKNTNIYVNIFPLMWTRV